MIRARRVNISRSAGWRVSWTKAVNVSQASSMRATAVSKLAESLGDKARRERVFTEENLGERFDKLKTSAMPHSSQGTFYSFSTKEGSSFTSVLHCGRRMETFLPPERG